MGLLVVRAQLYPANRQLLTIGQLLIIDSIPDGELQTARRLREDVETFSAEIARAFPVSYARVRTSIELFAAIESLRRDVETTGQFPVIHFECHGSPLGLALASGEHVSWRQLRPHLVLLNLAAHVNTLVVFACCYGAFFAGTFDPGDRAAFAAVFGPNAKLSAGVLEDAFRAYHRALLGTANATAAIEATRVTAPDWGYFYATAEGVFRLALAGYVRRARAQGLEPLLPKHVQAWRIVYFGLDLFPANADRFVVTFDEICAAAAVP